MPGCEERFGHSRLALFLLSALRGAGQAVFANSPLAGLLILIALASQSGWLFVMALLGLVSSTLTSRLLGLDTAARRNGLYGYNGLLIGAALATFGVVSNSPWQLPAWCLISVTFSALATGLMAGLTPWWNRVLRIPLLTLPFVLVTYFAIAGVQSIPQEPLAFSLAPPDAPAGAAGWRELASAQLSGFGQIFLADRPLAGGLVLLSLLLYSPIAAAVGLLGAAIGSVVAIQFGATPQAIGSGLWGYNAILTAVALGGTFFAPNRSSLTLALIAATCSVLLGVLLTPILAPMPILTLPFVVATQAAYLIQRRSLPALVPVSMQALASPEEHRLRFLAAQRVLTQFRQQLAAAAAGQRLLPCWESASAEDRETLQQVFEGLDQDGDGRLSDEELFEALQRQAPKPSADEMRMLSQSFDLDSDGSVEFSEFAELALRHRRFVFDADDLLTYLHPTDTDGDGMLSLEEVHRTLTSVGLAPLSPAERQTIERQIGTQAMTWSDFVRLLLLT